MIQGGSDYGSGGIEVQGCFDRLIKRCMITLVF